MAWPGSARPARDPAGGPLAPGSPATATVATTAADKRMGMTNAERQRRYRERRAAGVPIRERRSPRPKPRPTRGAATLAELRTLQAGIRGVAPTRLPESLADSSTAELIEGVLDVDLDPLDIELPRGSDATERHGAPDILRPGRATPDLGPSLRPGRGVAAGLRVGAAPGRAGSGEPDADRGSRAAPASPLGRRAPRVARGT